MLKNAPTLAIVAVDTEENEPLKISLFHFIISIVSLQMTDQIVRARRKMAMNIDSSPKNDEYSLLRNCRRRF